MNDIIIASLKEENDALKERFLGALRIIESFEENFEDIEKHLGIENTKRSKLVCDYVKVMKEIYHL